MKIAIIYAHPVRESLNGSLLNVMVKRLEAGGHSVQVSDLYAMGWKAVLDGDDFLNREPGARLDPMLDSTTLAVTLVVPLVSVLLLT